MTRLQKSLFTPSEDAGTSSDRRTALPGLVGTDELAALAAKPRRSLASQLTLAFFLASFLMALTASGVLYWATVATLLYADDQVIDKRAGTVIDILLASELNEGLLAHEVNEDNQGPRQIFMRVVSSYEPIRLETEGMQTVLTTDTFPVPKNSTAERATIRLPDGRRYRAASFRIGVAAKPEIGDAILQVATDTSLDEASLSLFKKIFFSVIGAALPLSALSAWYIVNWKMKPLARITTASQLIDAGKLNQRIALADLPAELHELAHSFNSMLARLEATWSDLKNYADTIAHEMRTPLNRMRLGCEIALDKAETVAEFRDVMGAAVGECERLTRLLQGLLFLARVDSKQASITPMPVLLEEHLNTVCEYFEADAAELGIELSMTCEPGLVIEGDRDLLQQAIANPVANSLAHTPRGGSIRIDARRRGSDAEIVVEDTGEGVTLEEQAHIFDRFYRAGKSAVRQKSAGNLGLGLSIAKGIAELHGGRISMLSEPGKGTRISITIPAVLAQKVESVRT